MSRPVRVVSRVRAAAAADGADRSGLAALLSVHALQAAGDALIAVALAGTVFFDVPLGQARGRVALYLLLTLLPFALLVPVAGPLLDRFRHGRRTVLSVTTGARGLLAWSMAGSLASLSLYPQALAVLVLTRAYGVARSAAVVRVRPPALGLVAAGARLNIVATAGSGVAAAVGVGLSRTVGSPWSLRLAALLLLGAALAAQRLPAHVDEIRTSPGAGPGWRVRQAPDGVRPPLLASVALRAVGGLLTVALAFLLRAEHTSGPVIGVVLGAALAGSLLGTVLAGRLPATTTARLTGAGLSASALALLVAAVLGRDLPAAVAVGTVGLAASLAKYALDAALQTLVPAASRGNAFASSETALQLAWAAGAGVGLGLSALPAARTVCLLTAGVLLAAALVTSHRISGSTPLRSRSTRPSPSG